MAPRAGQLKGQDIVALDKSLTSTLCWAGHVDLEPSFKPWSYLGAACSLSRNPATCSNRKVLSLDTQSLAHLLSTDNHCPDFYHRLMSVLQLHMEEQHVPLCVWILSFNIVSVRLIHIVARSRLLFSWLCNIPYNLDVFVCICVHFGCVYMFM